MIYELQVTSNLIVVIKILQHLRTCPELLKSCICDPEIRGGAIYYNAKGQTLRQVKERRWPLLIVVKKSYKLQEKGKLQLE